MRFLWDLLKSTLLYLGVVAGGLTLFLIFAPLFGYLPYSDRPGPGWYADFPALGWADFWANAWRMLDLGLFIAVLIAIGGVATVLIIRAVERLRLSLWTIRIAGGLISALVTAYFMLGAGWYIALGLPAWVWSMVLGAVAGACVLPHRPSPAAAVGD